MKLFWLYESGVDLPIDISEVTVTTSREMATGEKRGEREPLKSCCGANGGRAPSVRPSVSASERRAKVFLCVRPEMRLSRRCSFSWQCPATAEGGPLLLLLLALTRVISGNIITIAVATYFPRAPSCLALTCLGDMCHSSSSSSSSRLAFLDFAGAAKGAGFSLAAVTVCHWVSTALD